MTQFLLDSGDPDEYWAISTLAKEHNEVLFGATTNPTLIAKSASWRMAGTKVTQDKAFALQKEIVLEIIEIVPGPVSAEVYADDKTTADEMISQAREIAKWHERVVIKLPTTLEAFKARTVLRHEKIPINNTLVFSQQQVFAINLHEQIITQEAGVENFISPFVGRLDDVAEDGMAVIEHAMKLKRTYNFTPLILLSSVRRAEHIKRGFDCEVDLITAPAKVYQEWFTLTNEQKQTIDVTSYCSSLKPINYWEPPPELLAIDSIDAFTQTIASGALNIQHQLTDTGLARFASDWQALIA